MLFLKERCPHDEDLAEEVASLLLSGDAEGPLEQPLMGVAASLLDDHTAWTVGQQIGPYEITGRIGSGGMGEVFQARDTRLGRAVAIKAVRAEFTDRFLAEARAIAALNHSNICTLHDIGPGYLVMEFVEGETLAEVFRGERFAVEDVARYGAQIADALWAAHSRGIIHRDLKPSNLMVSATRGAWLFDRETKTFRVHPVLGGVGDVKSASLHPGTGQWAYTVADQPDWWTSKIRFDQPDLVVERKGERLYKVRWVAGGLT